MGWLLKRRITTWLLTAGIGTLLVLAIGSLSLGSKIQRLATDTLELVRTERALKDLELNLIDSLNGIRGYIITGNPDYLDAYYLGVQHIAEIQPRLAIHLKAAHGEALNLNELIEQRLKLMSIMLDTKHSKGPDAIKSELNEGSNKKAMDHLRSVIQSEGRSLKWKVVEAATEIQTLTDAFISIVFAGLLIAGGVSAAQFHLFRRVIAAQKRAQELLQTQTQNTEISSRFSETMHAAKSRDESYKIIRSYGSTILRGTGCALYVYNNSRDQLELATNWGEENEPQISERFRPDECWALRRGRIYTGSEVEGQVNCTHHLSDHPRNYICLPITAAGQTSGLLYVYTEKFEHDALDELIQQAVMFADQLSLALLNLALSERLQQQAIRDSLTGLFNRRVLDEMLNREFARADRNNYQLSFLMLDIDHFKKLNDTHGHVFGDQVIKKVADLLSSKARQTDTVCRYGGEEFLVIFANCDLEHAAIKAEKIRLAVNALKLGDTGHGAVSISISIGIACYPDSADNKEAVIKLADEALYRAKRNGRDQVCVYEEMPNEPEEIPGRTNVHPVGVKNAVG